MSALPSPSVIPSLAVPTFEPEHFLWIDFETFYDADYTLKKLSTSDYIRDPRFEMIGVAVNDGDDTVWMMEEEFRAWAKTVQWDRTAVGCHHAHFDGLILSHHFDVHPAVFFCTMSMARTFGIDGGVSLQSLAEHFQVGHKGNEVLAAKGKHRADFSPAELRQYGLYCINDVELTKPIFYKMLDRGFPDAELWLVASTVKMFTDPKFVVDEEQLGEYLIWERQRKADLLERISTVLNVKFDRKAIGSNAVLAQAFVSLGISPPMKVSPSTGKPIYAFAKNDPGMQELLEHERDEVRWLAEARIGVKSTINETRAERFLSMGKGGRPMPCYLNYWKAHTGRWAGGDRRNFQNLGRVDDRKPMSGKLKKSLLAPDGDVVVAADSGSIEARVNAWMAGHTALVEALRKNEDIYSSFASEVYGRRVDRKRKPDHPQFNPEDESAGGLGKVSQLALGYQMGWPKFATTLLAGPMGAAPILLTGNDAVTMDVDLEKFVNDDWKMNRMNRIVSRLNKDALTIHCAVADKIVRTYRQVNKPIVELWGLMGEVIETMCSEDCENGASFAFGPDNLLLVVRHGIVLPNGLMLRYPGLRQSEDTEDEDGEIIKGGFSYLGQYGKRRQHIYGGLLTENVIQALARIIIGEQMLSVKAKYNYDTKLTTHDEIAVIVPEVEGPLASWRLVEEMKIPPSWARGLPLTAEGGFARSLGMIKKTFK